MTTCIGLHNGTEYVLAADGRVSSGRKIGTDTQNKLIRVSEEITCAFSGSQYIFNKLAFFLQHLDDPVDLVNMSSFRQYKDRAKDDAEDSVARFLGIEDSSQSPTIKDSELAIRIIWEAFLTGLEGSGTYTFEDDSVPHEYSAILLFATHLSIFEVDTDGYVSHGNIKVIGNPAAIGSVLSDLFDQAPNDFSELSLPSASKERMQGISKKAIRIVSLLDTGTCPNINFRVYP